MNEIKLLIDDVEMPMIMAYPFYQKHPYPGDHTFKLKITFTSKVSMDVFIRSYELENPENLDWSMRLFKLSEFWSDSDSPTVKYFLNNVMNVKINEDSIELIGECSSILK